MACVRSDIKAMNGAIPGTVVVLDIDGRMGGLVDALREGEIASLTSVETADAIAAIENVACVLVPDGPAVDGYGAVDGVRWLEAVRTQTTAPVGVYILGSDRNSVVRALKAGADTAIRVPPERQAMLVSRIERLAGADEAESIEQRYASLLECYPQALYLKDCEGRFVDNTAYAFREFEDLPLDHETIRGLSDYELFDPELADELFEKEQDLLAREEGIHKRLDNYIEDGEEHWVSTTKVPRYDDDGNLLGLVGDVRDVTSIKRRERMMATLHEATRRLVRADDATDVGATAIDIASDIGPSLQARIDLVDSETGEFGQSIIEEETFEWQRSTFRQALDSGTAQYRTEDGTFVGVETDSHDHDTLTLPEGIESVIGLRLPLGRHGVLGLDAETGEMEPFTIELAHVLAGNIEAALDRAEHERHLTAQADRLEEFAAIGSHELRNRLQIALGSAERARALDDSKAVEDVINTLGRMDRLISQLLTLARTGATSQTTARVALSGIAKRAWQDVESDGDELRIVDDAIVTANRDGLVEVFEVLFRAATSNTENAVVRAGTTDDGFYVADGTTSIPATDLDTLLEPTYSELDGGIGDNVYLVSVIADAHDWGVDVENGDGLRFVFSNVEMERVE